MSAETGTPKQPEREVHPHVRIARMLCRQFSAEEMQTGAFNKEARRLFDFYERGDISGLDKELDLMEREIGVGRGTPAMLAARGELVGKAECARSE